MFDSTSSRLIESWRSTFLFSLSCFIDAFSTKNRIRCANESDCCKINNTMRSFKNEALNVVFLLETFFIHSRNAKSSLTATFSKRSVFEILLISRDNDLKDFFFQSFFNNRNDFFLFQEVLCVFYDWKFCAICWIIVRETVASRHFVDCFECLWRDVVCIRQKYMSITCRWRKVFFFSFHFCFWKCSCFRSKFIFWNLNFHYFCFFSRSRSRNRVYKTSCLRNFFFQIDTLFLNRIRLIFFIIWFLYD
jgi:hypothetical protein